MDKENQDILKEYNFTGDFHEKREIVINNIKLTTAGVICGCGLVQITGLIKLLKSGITKKMLKPELDILKENGVGAIIGTLGEAYFGSFNNNYEQTILDLGFELLSEYSNYQHGQHGNYKQRLYILKL